MTDPTWAVFLIGYGVFSVLPGRRILSRLFLLMFVITGALQAFGLSITVIDLIQAAP